MPDPQVYSENSSHGFQGVANDAGMLLFKTLDNGDGTACPIISLGGVTVPVAWSQPLIIDTTTPLNVNVNNTPNVAISGTPSVNVGNTVAVSGTVSPVMPSYTYRRLASAATTTIKTGAGILRRIIINSPVTLSSVTVYDSTTGSGTVIATISSIVGQTYNYDVAFTNGLTIVSVFGPDITVVYQ